MEIDLIYSYMEQGRYDMAAEALKKLLLQAPSKEVQALQVSLYIESQEHEKAVQSLHCLQRLAPGDSYTLFLEARVLFMEGCSLLVLHKLQSALQGANRQPVVLEKIYNLLGQCYRYFGNSAESTKSYLQAVKYADTKQLAALEYSNYLFNRHYLPAADSATELAIGKKYNEFFTEIPQFLHRRRTFGKGKIRVGYISPDFRNHVVLRFSYALLRYYNHEKFEVHCYARGVQDKFSETAARMVDVWRDISSYSDEAAARCIYEDQIDILFDLSGHTKNGCLPVLAYRPAPVQLSGIGYFATTGLATVDYFLGDNWLDGEAGGENIRVEEASAFSEKLLVLSRSHFCYTPLYDMPISQGTPCKKNGYITYGSFNNFTKVTDDVLVVWSEILRQVKGARLLLKAEIFNAEDGIRLVCERLEKAGVDLKQVELRHTTTSYLEEYNDMDIALDTFPYPGGGTTCDALYMGVPVITLEGKSHGARFGCSLLHNAGLEEFVAVDQTDYVQKAVALAGDFDLLEALHLNIRKILQHSPLMDGTGYIKEMEGGYQKIWQDFCDAQESPDGQRLVHLKAALKKFAVQQDEIQLLAAADGVFSSAPRDKSTVEELAAIYIDHQDLPKAAEVVDYLKERFGAYGYACFLQARLYYAQGELRNAEGWSRKGLQDHCMEDWQRGCIYDLLALISKAMGDGTPMAGYYKQAADCKELATGKAAEYSNYLLSLHYRELDVKKIYQEAVAYGSLFKGVPQYSHPHGARHERLRIGYISPDFCEHVVALFSQAFFRAQDKLCFEIFAYARCGEDARSRELASMAEHWLNIQDLSDEEAAKRIYLDEIDILVDLSGHTGNNCLPILAYKPAPIQVCGVGWFNTTGLPTVDYFLADVYTIPESAGVDYFSEKVLRLPHSHLCYTPPAQAPQFCSSAPCRRNGYITFGCFNVFTKVTDEMLRLWAAILNRLPQARLFLKAAVFDNIDAQTTALERLKAEGIPLQRLSFEGYSANYFQAYDRIDIALDTYPYPGGGTTCDALYMGVPVLTWAGQDHHTRFGYSLLMNIGLPQLCAFSATEYVEKAVQLGSDFSTVMRLRQGLRRQMRQSAIMDANAYMPELEACYRKIWQDFQDRCSRQPAISKITAGRLQAALDDLQACRWREVIHQVAHWQGMGIEQSKLLSAAAFSYYRLQDYPHTIYWMEKALQNTVAQTAEQYIILGDALWKQGDYIKANQAREKAADFLPQTDSLALQNHIWMDLGQSRMGLALPGGPEAYWQAYEVADGMVNQCNAYSSWLLILHLQSIGQADLFAAHIGYSNIFKRVVSYTHQRNQVKKAKLRLGYISADFREHVMYSFYFQMLASYDRERFEVFCYSMNSKVDVFTESVRNLVDVWRNVSQLSYADAAAQIFADGIDILFDLSGHTAHSGLPVLAWKPAPVQLSGLGYMDTTALSAVDYFLTDAFVDPIGTHEAYFTEKLLRLTSQFCYSGRLNLPSSSGAPVCQQGYVLFGVFNSYQKITDEMLDIWLKILQRVPESRILFKNYVMIDDAAVDIFAAKLQRIGFDLDRVIFEASSSDYMYRYLDVDIALDTYPYPGGGTTCDALFMGVPVVSLYGERHSSRFGLSILSNAGVGELAVASTEEYIERAAALAMDRELLNLLHRNLRQMMQQTSLMDGVKYMKELEDVYENIWQEWQGQNA